MAVPPPPFTATEPKGEKQRKYTFTSTLSLHLRRGIPNNLYMFNISSFVLEVYRFEQGNKRIFLTLHNERSKKLCVETRNEN